MSDVVIIINFIKLIWQSNVFVSKIQNEKVLENYIYFNVGVTRVTHIASVFVFFLQFMIVLIFFQQIMNIGHKENQIYFWFMLYHIHW